MDPSQHQRNQLNPRRNPVNRDGTSGVSGTDENPENPEREAAAAGALQPVDRQPRYSNGFTMIPPNPSRRTHMKTVAQKEEEEFQRWRENNRVTSVHVNPERLGGGATLAEAREKQFTNLRGSKLQKKLHQEDLEKRRKQEEEEKLQKMKAEQRQKAERLEERRQQEEQTRREELHQDNLRRTEMFLQNLERRAPVPLASSRGPQTTTSRIQAVESEQKRGRDPELERKRVNAAFLDKLEGRGSGAATGGVQEPEGPSSAPDQFTHRPSAAARQQAGLGPAEPDPERMETDDPEPDFNWALMKLIHSFPGYSQVFLEDILDQCHGDYEQACMLLV